MCLLILQYMCPHTAMYVSSYCYMRPHTAIYVSSYCYVCVLMLLYMCPQTAIHVSSHCYICLVMLLNMRAPTGRFVFYYDPVAGAAPVMNGEYINARPCEQGGGPGGSNSSCGCLCLLLYMWPHTATCVLILLYLCPHTAIYVSSYCYICVVQVGGAVGLCYCLRAGLIVSDPSPRSSGSSSSTTGRPV